MSTTPNLLISHIAGSQNNKEVTANTAFDDFDGTITGSLTVTFANADYAPTADQAHYNARFLLGGTNSATRKFIVPTTNKFYLVKNITTDGNPINVTTASGTGVLVAPADGYVWVYCDGVNVVLVFAFGAGGNGASKDYINQSAPLSGVVLYSVPAGAGGLYEIRYNAKQSMLDTVSCSLGGVNGFQVTYTDNDDATVPTTAPGPTNSSNTTVANVQDVVIVNAAAGSNILFSFDYSTGSGAPSTFAMEYNLHIRVRRIS